MNVEQIKAQVAEWERLNVRVVELEEWRVFKIRSLEAPILHQLNFIRNTHAGFEYLDALIDRLKQPE